MGNTIGGLGFGGFFGMFNLFSVMFSVVFVLVFGIILYTLFRSIKQEHKNNHSPKLTVEVKVVSKRTNYHRSSGSGTRMGHTTYYVTFEVASGDRMELNVAGTEYGLLVEGDWGELTFQGTRFLGFTRKIMTQ